MRTIPLVTMLMFLAASSSATFVRDIDHVDTITIPATSPTVTHISVFTDTNCPYCMLLHRRRDELLRQGIEIEYLFYPRSGPDSASYRQAVAVWCSSDRLAALDLALAGVELPEATCDNPVREHYELARKLELRGTPAVVSADGSVTYGFPSAAKILDVGDATAGARGVHTEFDQAEAALAILDILRAGREVPAEKWAVLWASNGYKRLLERERSFGLDRAFKERLETWLRTPDTYARADEFRRAVNALKQIDVQAAKQKARAYLPDNIDLQATYFAVIKHTPNSFVFDLLGEPAIFLTVDPQRPALFAQSAMTHELHHVGVAQCPELHDYGRLTAEQKWVADSLFVFGEGLAVLAAAGDPDRHPLFAASAAEQRAWERDAADATAELERMQSFMQRVIDGEVPMDRRRSTLLTFVGTPDVPQGAAYTLGWNMAATIEKRFGRERLVNAACDFREVLKLYNDAARGTKLPSWSAKFLDSLFAG